MVQQQRALEATADLAFGKCLHSVFGVELERGVAAHPWGGATPAALSRGRRSATLDDATAVDVFEHVRDDLAEVLACADAPKSRLARHKPLLEHLFRAFPRPPAAVRCAAPRAHLPWCTCSLRG